MAAEVVEVERGEEGNMIEMANFGVALSRLLSR